MIGIGVIAGVECVIFANDPTVLGGAITEYARKKWARALEIARDNGIPYVSFVESAGADLRRDGGNGDVFGVQHAVLAIEMIHETDLLTAAAGRIRRCAVLLSCAALRRCAGGHDATSGSHRRRRAQGPAARTIRCTVRRS